MVVLAACFLASAAMELLWVLWARAIPAGKTGMVVGITMSQAALGLLAYSYGLGDTSNMVAIVLGHGSGSYVGMKLHLGEGKKA